MKHVQQEMETQRLVFEHTNCGQVLIFGNATGLKGILLHISMSDSFKNSS